MLERVVSTQSNAEKQAAILLNRQRGVGPHRISAIKASFGSLYAFWQSVKANPESLPPLLKTHWHNPDVTGLKTDLAWEAQHPDHHIITLDDSRYPLLLKQSPGAPAVLFVKGNLDALSSKQIAVVGSRRATLAGARDAFHFSEAFVKAGFCVTSGLALGVDAAAHRGALHANGETIAVLAHGLDQVFPLSHGDLAKAILAQNGALVSEFPIGVKPSPQYFPRRNRIISGLAGAVLVVEAAKRSGSLITARFAAEFGREVFAIPGSIHHTQSSGCHHLIRQGATLVEEPAHVLEAMGIWAEPLNTKQKEKTHLQLDKASMQLLQALGGAPTSVDSLVENLNRPAEAIASDLINLEILGLVRQVPGGYQKQEEV